MIKMITRFGIFGSVCFAFIAFFAVSPLEAAVNLISNPSAETLSGTLPANWNTNSWGTISASFEYTSSGYQSNHSMRVDVASRTSGDAKWYFDPVTVSPNTDYTFSDFYTSNVPTHVVAMTADAAGNQTYSDVAVTVASSSAAWKKFTGTIHTPANAHTMTVLHVIEKKGWLDIDNASLALVTAVPVTGLVPNNSVETESATNANLPAKWQHSSWGTNTPKYEYLDTEGHTGTHSVKLTMTNFVDGDAKWVFDPQALTPGKNYRFTAWYKTNTIPHVVAQYIKADGSEDYFGLPDPEPKGTGWQQYSDVFSVPNNVTSVSLFFFLSNNGYVQTDDYSITPFVYTPYNRGLVTLTFDDGFEENVTSVLPVLAKYGFKTTQCNATQYVEGLPAQEANIKKIAAAGHEICSHTVTHPMLTQLSTAAVDTELSHSQTFLRNLTGQRIDSFTSPFGDYNSAVEKEIAKYYTAHRTTDEGFNSKDNFNPMRLRVQNMQKDTTFAQYKAWVNKAKADKTWLILIYHVVGSPITDLEQFDTLKSDFDTQMSWLSTSGITVKTLKDALAEVKAQ